MLSCITDTDVAQHRRCRVSQIRRLRITDLIFLYHPNQSLLSYLSPCACLPVHCSLISGALTERLLRLCANLIHGILVSYLFSFRPSCLESSFPTHYFCDPERLTPLSSISITNSPALCPGHHEPLFPTSLGPPTERCSGSWMRAARVWERGWPGLASIRRWRR